MHCGLRRRATECHEADPGSSLSGNDAYGVDSSTDTIAELARGGIDGVHSSVTFSLAAFGNVENLTLTCAAAVSGSDTLIQGEITGDGVADFELLVKGADATDEEWALIAPSLV